MPAPDYSDFLDFAACPKAVRQALKRVLPQGMVIAEEEEMRPFFRDGLPIYASRPLAVLLPRDEADVIACLRVLADMKVPVVPRGAGTSLSGGAVPHPQGVVLSLAKLNRIFHLDPDRRLCRAQAGVRNAAISEAAAPHGLFYAPDPSSQVICSLGGNLAENAGGIHCLKYGLTTHNAASLRLITMEGEAVNLGEEGGMDAMPLVIGSEGLLGVIVEATVVLRPLPQEVCLLLAGFPGVAEAGLAVGAIIEEGLVPAALELMDALAIEASEAFCHPGYPLEAKALLLCELDGTRTQVEEEAALAREIFSRCGAFVCKAAQDEEERQRFWSGRKATFPAAGRLAPDYYCMDGTIPREALASVLEEIGRLSGIHGLRVMNVFHAGDGNLHPVILLDADDERQLQGALDLGSRILHACLKAGGSITGEHGVGVEKLDEMCFQFKEEELSSMRRVKSAFDPLGLLNPGKAIPTPRRCVEAGGRLVRGGAGASKEAPWF